MTGLIGVATWTIVILSYLLAYDFITGLIAMALNGFGLGGGLYFYDQCLAEIIDEDEITNGVRKSGMYYGVINFIIRLSSIINYLMIGIVFSGSDWETYSPNPGVDTLTGIQFLLSWFPIARNTASYSDRSSSRLLEFPIFTPVTNSTPMSLI